MLSLKQFYLPVIICLFSFHIRSNDSIKYNKISSYDVKGRYWDGEAVVNFTCGTDDNEYEILKDNHFISNYYKTRVGSVRFHNCQFREIKRKYGVEFYNLHTFNVSNVGLEILKKATLKDVGRLKTFLASNNRLTEISANVFAEAVSLQTIDFSNNAIQTINPHSFEGAIALTRLNLSANKIDQRTITYISSPSLTVLDVSLNPIGSLSIFSFGKVRNLEHLNLQRSNITSIGMNTFLRQHKLISVDLSGNRLTKLNINLFHPSAQNSLRSLSLNNNQLTELHCVLNTTLVDFTYLDLNNNNFNCSYLKAFMEYVKWERPTRIFDHNRSSMRNKIINGRVNGVNCKEDSSTSTYNQFQLETCPVIRLDYISVKKVSPVQAILILICVCILVIISVVYKKSGKRVRIIRNGNNLNWLNTGSTIRIVVE